MHSFTNYEYTINLYYVIHTTFGTRPRSRSRRLGLSLGLGLELFGLSLGLVMFVSLTSLILDDFFRKLCWNLTNRLRSRVSRLACGCDDKIAASLRIEIFGIAHRRCLSFDSALKALWNFITVTRTTSETRRTWVCVVVNSSSTVRVTVRGNRTGWATRNALISLKRFDHNVSLVALSVRMYIQRCPNWF